MQYVNVRLNCHDPSVAPYVSLGRGRPDLKPVVLDTPRTSTQISAERDAAQAEREALEASRSDVLLNGTAGDVANLDHRIAVTKIRLDQLEVQHAAALASEAEAKATYEAEQKRRKDLHRKAVKASAEVAALADQYVAEAQRLVPLLAKIRERADLIEAANYALPDDADPVPTGEPPVPLGEQARPAARLNRQPREVAQSRQRHRLHLGRDCRPTSLQDHP